MSRSPAELGQHRRTLRITQLKELVVQAGVRWVFCETPVTIQALRRALQDLQDERRKD